MKLKRRDLLKMAGLTAAGSVLPGCDREVQTLIPYLLPDDEIVPGVANWYASMCQECEAGCGVIVRVMEGRAKKVEGNPGHPVNRGKLCAQGQAALQGLYNPDRLRSPLKRDGPRGSGRFRSITWEEGVSEWVGQLRQHPRASALISRPLSGTLADLFSHFMADIGGRMLFYDGSDAPAVLAATEASFGVRQLPHYDLAHTDYLLSFGAPFLEHWLSPVAFGIAYGEMRQARPTVRGRFVQVEPRLSLTAASADRWIPIRPGSEGLMVMAIGQVILREGKVVLPAAERAAFEKFYFGASFEQIAIATQVPTDQLVQTAREFLHAAAPLAIGGGMVAAQTNTTEVLAAINGLNILVGNIGRPGGVQFLPAPEFPGISVDGKLVGAQSLVSLGHEFETQARRLLHLYQANPVFTVPASTGFQQSIQKAAFIVSFSSFMDESTAMADLILPDHTPLESWSDHRLGRQAAAPVLTLGQPVVTPLYETRAVGDVVLEGSKRLGGKLAERLPWGTFKEMLQARWREFLAHQEPSESFEAAWVVLLQHGGWWKEQAPLPIRRQAAPPPYRPPSFAGDEETFPFYFYPYPSLPLGDGRGANRPWLQELPDTLTSGVWGSWVEINPKTAHGLGLQQGDVVRVISPYGQLEAPVVYFPGMRPDLICIPMGQGHTAYGRYAQGRGVNPLSLLGPAMDQRAGCLAKGNTRVRLERARGTAKLVMLDQAGQDPFRQSLQEKGDL